MSESCSAEDFARANLATRGEFEVARRVDPDDALAWRACHDDGREVFLTDDCMSRAGWTPVVESRVTEHALPDAQGNAARKRQKLVDHIADQDRVIRRRNDEITALRLELADAQAPLSLESLAAAYEAAEQADECREGDVLISTSWKGAGDFRVYSARSAKDLPPGLRILFRAPRREPHENLADAIREVWPSAYDEIDIGSLAYALHERGVGISKNGRE